MADDLSPSGPLAEAAVRAVRLFEAGRLDEAEPLFVQLRAAQAFPFEAEKHLGIIAAIRGDWIAGRARLEAAMRLNGADPLVANVLSVCCFEGGDFAPALAYAERAAALAPAFAEAHNSRGTALLRLGRPAEALAAFQAALALGPEDAAGRVNLANALRDLDRPAEALANLERALALEPALATAHVNRGDVLQDLGRHAEALAAYDAALALDPASVDARWNRAVLLLLLGRFDAGWREYEWRWRRSAPETRPRAFAAPLWLGGEPLAGRSILLHGEQGLGDCLQFARHVRDVAALGARVTLEVYAPLVELLRGLEGVAEILPRGAALPRTDFQCPLMSLPLALGHTAGPPPLEAPYLQAPPDRRALWAERLGARRAVRVGLAFSGSPGHRADARRSLAFAALAPHLPAGPDYHLLQKAVAPADREALAGRPDVAVWSDQLEDFADTAALAEQMDLVVSVDTSLAHLAGALGRPTRILVPYDPDWRWGLSGEASAWYPSVRLRRQAARDDWSRPLAAIADELGALLAQSRT